MKIKLTVQGLCFRYNSTDVLQDVGLEVGAGELVSVVGPNGSGKSTLLRCINKILRPRRGTILLHEKDMANIPLKEIARLVGHVPQGTASPFPTTVYDTVLLGRRPHVGWGVSAHDRRIVAQMLVLMGLKDFALRQLNQLSGGERQMVFIARALAQEPEVMLLDEPTSSLDLRHQLKVLNLIHAAVKERRMLVIMAVHDLNLAAQFSDRIILLDGGRIRAAGEPSVVLTADNIRRVYGVEVRVDNNSRRPYIVPLGPT